MDFSKGVSHPVYIPYCHVDIHACSACFTERDILLDEH